jgi:pyruvate kinase
VTRFALEEGILSFGDLVVVTSGAPFGKKGSTNMMRVESIGEILVRGHKGFGSIVTGKISTLLSPENRDPETLRGRIVVILYCDNAFLTPLKFAAGVILQNHLGDTASEKYAGLLARTFDIPVMTRVDGATSALRENEEVTLDPQRGLVYRGSTR